MACNNCILPGSASQGLPSACNTLPPSLALSQGRTSAHTLLGSRRPTISPRFCASAPPPPSNPYPNCQPPSPCVTPGKKRQKLAEVGLIPGQGLGYRGLRSGW